MSNAARSSKCLKTNRRKSIMRYKFMTENKKLTNKIEVMQRKLSNLPTTEEILKQTKENIQKNEDKLPKNIIHTFEGKDRSRIIGLHNEVRIKEALAKSKKIMGICPTQTKF